MTVGKGNMMNCMCMVFWQMNLGIWIYKWKYLIDTAGKSNLKQKKIFV